MLIMSADSTTPRTETNWQSWAPVASSSNLEGKGRGIVPWAQPCDLGGNSYWTKAGAGRSLDQDPVTCGNFEGFRCEHKNGVSAILNKEVALIGAVVGHRGLKGDRQFPAWPRRCSALARSAGKSRGPGRPPWQPRRLPARLRKLQSMLSSRRNPSLYSTPCGRGPRILSANAQRD